MPYLELCIICTRHHLQVAGFVNCPLIYSGIIIENTRGRGRGKSDAVGDD